jgi:single-strand DNA-binding protein
MVNEASFCVTGYIATQPKLGWTRNGTRTLFMRLGWTPRRVDKSTGEWADQPTSFVSVICYRRVAENASECLRRGDPVVIKGTLRVREYGEENGPKRSTVEVVADAIGHDLSRGTSFFKKTTEQLEKTAAEREREQEMAASGREPLLADRSAALIGPAPQASGESDEPYPLPDDLEQAGAELAGADEFDDEEARQMLAREGEAAEPVGAAS